MSLRTAELVGLENLLRAAFAQTLAQLSVPAMVAAALPPLPPKRAKVRVLSVGKAAAAMMRGALERWPDRIDRGLVVTVGSPPGSGLRDPRVDALPADGRIETLFASHPIPDDRSVDAAERALSLASGLGTADLVTVLISGGASSLLALPPDGMSLADKRALVGELLASGASIRDVNLVRRHVSRIKGGRLAAAAGRARVLTLALSDVIGGGLHDIGSGPSVPDPTTVDDARAVLRRFAPAWESRLPLTESLKPSGAPRWRGSILAGPEVVGGELVRVLQAAGLEHTHQLPPDEGDASVVAALRGVQARALAPHEALVIPCEPTLRLPPDHGRGGRAGWIALRVLAELPDDVVLLCGATDGVDGSSGSAGAVVSAAARFPGGAPADRDAVEQALARYADGPAHEALKTRLAGGPTGLNFADVHVLARL